MNDAYMVAEPGTVFSVSPMANSNELLVQEGTVYFSVTESSRPIQFDTPGGVVTTRETSLTGSELKGYVRVSGNETEIGVIEGGTMTVETSSGEMAITPGKQVTIAVLNPDPPAAATGGEGGSTLVTDIALGVVGTAVIVGGIYGLHKVVDSGSDGGGSDGSPSSP
jgi:ferric-dicitrate binding protein FerR (iron transport regulator)